MRDPTWKNTTSYSRERGTTEPREWTLKTRHLRIVVHRHIDYAADLWLMSVDPLGLRNVVLGEPEIDKAKTEAIRKVRRVILALAEELASVEDGR